MARRRKSRAQRLAPIDKISHAKCDDSVSSTANTLDSDDSREFQQHQDSLTQDNSTAKQSYTTRNAAPPTKTLSYLSTIFAKVEEALPTLKQSLFITTVFVLGAYTGIAYAGFVQEKYGFGKSPTMEATYLPFGPSTHPQTSQLLAAQHALSFNSTKLVTSQKKKQILLNRDNNNPDQKKRAFSTLFGIEYNSIIVELPDTSDGAAKKKATPAAQVVSPSWYKFASNKQVSLIASETDMIQSIAQKVYQTIPNFKQRASLVAFGGPNNNDAPATNWWPAKTDTDPSALSGLEGGQLLYAYLFIMKWNPHPHFPFRLCGENGCPPQRAISHSLEWREKFMPWRASPAVVAENTNGDVYHRGFSPAKRESDKHAIVWLRLRHVVKDNLAFFRGILNSVDRAIGEALVKSNGETGKFNVIIDCGGFSVSGRPTLQALKQGVTMLQDHYPNRLGMIFLAHVSRPGDMFLNVVLRLITKEVRDKIKVLPSHDKTKSLAILKTVVDEEYIPEWLGGTDAHQFNAEEYYSAQYRCTEEEAHGFLTTMPYHAK